jgi:hypothetical protein
MVARYIGVEEVEYKGVDTKTGEVIFSHGPVR